MALNNSIKPGQPGQQSASASVNRPTNTQVPTEFGFNILTPETKHRLIVNLQGLEKSGKNHFSFATTPEPIYCLSMDQGLEGMVEKFLKPPYSKKIYVAKFRLDIQPGMADDQAVADSASRVWDAYWKMFYQAVNEGRTVVADTFTEAWELLRLARFGKLLQVPPNLYPKVNAEFRDLMRMPLETTCNVIYLHKMEDEWSQRVNDKGKEVGYKTGRIVRKGMKDVPYNVQVNAQSWREEGGGPFHVTVLDSRQNGEIAGLDMEQPNCNFADLGMFTFPGTTAEDWTK